MYSGEKPGALKAIKTFVELARKSKVIPVKASEYAAIADDYFATEIQHVDASSWMIARRGALQTLRLDDADAVDLDDAKSTGVLARRGTAGRCISHSIRQLNRRSIAIRAVAQSGPAFDKGSARCSKAVGRLRAERREACGFAVTAHGFGAGDMVWQTTPGQAFDVQVSRPGVTARRTVITADASGRLECAVGDGRKDAARGEVYVS